MVEVLSDGLPVMPTGGNKMNTLGIVLLILIFLGIGLGLTFIKVHESMEEARRLQRQKAIRLARREKDAQLEDTRKIVQELLEEW